jgi:hypothetical protein
MRGFNARTSLDALEKWYKLDPNLFRASPEELKHMTYNEIENYDLEIGVTLQNSTLYLDLRNTCGSVI